MDMSSPTRTIRQHATLAAVALAAALAACGPAATVQERIALQGLRADNGLTANGLSNNGLSQNGLSNNGLSQNGLSQNGLSQNGFATWFNLDAALANSVMSYVVKCAVSSGQTRTWTNPSTGVSYVWPGLLGLAPSWSSGSAATESEQQVVTACLAAHVNKYGVSVSVSVQGRSATGVAIPLATNELSDYPVQEACFFGNFFRGEGVFLGLDHSAWSDATSSVRACALESSLNGTATQCPPMFQVGSCSAYCSKDTGATYWKSCSYGGKSYKPITTRLRSQDVYTCGDGTCQFTEGCGWGSTAESCRSDCGRCD
jgi:hypothetical protein